jgi:nucleotide-binding universal stress UspA family protein
MPKIENIIVALDDTRASEQMAQTLLKLPCFSTSKMTLLHVVPSQITAERMREEWERGQTMLASALNMMVVQPGVPVVTQLVEGDPKLVVCDVAESTQNPLLIMGSRGLNRLSAILQNSVSQYVFQLASCPMLLVRDGVYIKYINKIMVALDGSKASKQALDLTIEMARGMPHIQVILTRVYLDDLGEMPDPVLEAAMSSFKANQIPCRVVTASGDPGIELVRLARETGTDLLVLGSPDRRPNIARSLPDLDRLLGKSTSDYVRVHAECPVLLARSRE